MKKLSLTVVLVFVVFLMTQCKKNIEKIENNTLAGETMDVTLDASTETDKTAIDGYSVSWVSGDRIHVVGSVDGYLGYMTAQSSGNPVKFKGTIKKTTAAQNYMFYYVGSNDFTLSGDNGYTFSVANQYGLLSGETNSITNKFQLMKGSLYVGGTPGAELGSVTLNCMMSIIRLNLQLNGTSMRSGSVTISGSYSSVKINTKTGEYVSSNPLTSGNITLTNASGSYYMAIIPGNQTGSGTSQTLTFVSSGCQTSFTATIAANKFYNKDSAKVANMVGTMETSDYLNFNDAAMNVVNLPIWAKKNIGATNGSSIQSWYGNYYAWGEILPYYADGHAYDVTCSSWRSMTTGAGNTTISNGYAWKTYSQGGSSSFAEWTNKPYGSDNILTRTGSNIRDVARRDWGGNWRMPIGGGAGEWKTLKDNTYFVWTSSYKGVTGLCGYIVYKVKSEKDKGSQATPAPSESSYSTDNDPHIFLPAAGIRNGADLNGTGGYGNYWAGNVYSSEKDKAYYLYFESNSVTTHYHTSRCSGCCVRPVQ